MVVFIVSFLVMKYRVLIWILSDGALIRVLEKRFDGLKCRKPLLQSSLSRNVVHRRIIAVLRLLYPKTSCMVNSFVLNESLMLFGYTDQKINFGVKYENDKLLAHAWVGDGGDFIKVYEL